MPRSATPPEGPCKPWTPRSSEFAKRYLAQGRAEGRAEGVAQGEIKGEAKVLLKLLTLKFGTLPDEVAQRVQAASIEELDRWTERVLSAQSLQQILDG